MSTPDTPSTATAEDLAEQRATPTGDAAPPALPDLPLEAPDADALEQSADAGPAPHRVAREVPAEVPEADAVEQAQVEPLDEDAYRE
jgi:hypothetical protein